ncbi:MAG: helix-turn-helix domain-containing protein [Cytophagia bacterium]|nr:helix-turn-helix domain-containing protein [Cytophagia bacterium]
MNDKSYKDWSLMSDKALSEVIGGFVKHHRLKQQMTQAQAAKAAGMSRSTLSLLERGEPVNLMSLIQVLRVLDLLYVMEAFQMKEEISPLAYAKMKKKQKQRARVNKVEEPKEDLGW